MPVSEETYERVALEDGDRVWELVCGRLREKPPVTMPHAETARNLVAVLSRQLDRRRFSVDLNQARLRISTGRWYVPDVCVIPRELVRRQDASLRGRLEMYIDPLPLVVEVWSPSTGEYDVEEKLREYQWRGDAEIWRIHPYEKTLIAWRRQPDGSYTELHFSGEDRVQPVALPGVTIALTELFELL